RLKNEILAVLEYFGSKSIDVVFFGQTEEYDKPFSKVLMLNSLSGKKWDTDSYITQNSVKMNDLLRSFIPEHNYVDLFNLSSISKYDLKKHIPYMVDNNHLTKYGADQIIDYLIVQNKL